MESNTYAGMPRRHRLTVWAVITAMVALTVAALPSTGLAAEEPDAPQSVAYSPVADTSIGYRDAGSGDLSVMAPAGSEELLDLTWKAPAGQAAAERHETAHALLAFEFDDLHSGTTIESATLELEVIGQSSLDTGLSRITSDWDEVTTTWESRPDYDASQPDVVVNLPARSRVAVDVTQIVSDWVADPAANHGLALVPGGAGRHVTKLASRDHENVQVRPQLVVHATVPQAAVEPIFECAERAGDGSFRAYFGYHNRALDEQGRPTPFEVPFGDDNRVEPAVHEGLLPDYFEVPYVVDGAPGRTAPGPREPGAFVVEGWDGESALTWDLLGQTATASTATLCSDGMPPSPTARIQQAYDRGQLTAGEAAMAHLLAAANPDALEPPFHPAEGDEDVDPTWWWLGEAWDHLSAEDHAAIDALLSAVEEEPVDPAETESGDDSQMLQASSAEECGSATIRVLRFPFNCRAVIDAGNFDFEVLWAGDSRTPAVDLVIDETIAAVNHYVELGFAQPTGFSMLISPVETGAGLALPRSLTASGTVLLDPNPSPYLVHHELFHQMQYQYIGWKRLTDSAVRWWMEATAEWGAHQLSRLASEPNLSYAGDIDLFLATPSDRLESTSNIVGGREYGAFILAEYLQGHGGSAATIVRTWEAIGGGLLGRAPIDVVHDELTGVRSLTEFWVWSYVLSRDHARGVGFDDVDVPEWREFLQDNPITSAATAAAARPAREDTRVLMPSGLVAGDLGVAPGGAAFVDLNIAGTGNHVLTVNVSTRSKVDTELRLAAIPFGEYPSLCGPVSTGRPVNGTIELEVSAGAGCSSVTLAFVNEARPQIAGRASAKFNWEVTTETRAGNDSVYVAGIGTGHDANAYVVGVLRAAGYEVASGPTIPEDLAGIGQLWWIDWNNYPTAEDIPRLEDFVNDGGGLYLTGERPCCELLNQRVEEIVNQVVLDGPVEVGGFGDPFDQYGTVATNPDAVGGVSTTPHEVPGIRVAAPGGMAGVSGANVLAATPAGVPVAGIWDAEHLTGGGRLAVLMDINWLDSGARGPLADELVENLALYLSNLQDPPEPPPVVASVPDQDTSTADEDGDRPPTGPGVD